MFWILLWLYIIGAVNDAISALREEADFSSAWTHIDIALWPITVPFWIVYTLLTADDDDFDGDEAKG